jgi:hypothetical protein
MNILAAILFSFLFTTNEYPKSDYEELIQGSWSYVDRNGKTQQLIITADT